MFHKRLNFYFRESETILHLTHRTEELLSFNVKRQKKDMGVYFDKSEFIEGHTDLQKQDSTTRKIYNLIINYNFN